MPGKAEIAKPMLRPSVLYVAIRGGTYVELGERSFVIKGGDLAPIVSRMLAALDGTRTEADIRAALPQKLHALLDLLLSQLAKSMMLTEGDADFAGATLTNAGILGFLQDATPRWRECYREWTEAPITLLADDSIAPMLIRSLTSAGAANLTVVGRTGAGHPQAAGDDRWLSEDEAVRQTGGARSLLLYMGVGETDALPEVLYRLTESHEKTLPARALRGMGVLGPECHADLSPWLQVATHIDQADYPLPRSAIGVLAALLAFDALQSRIANWADDPEEAAGRATRFKLVRPDGSVSSHDAVVFAASGRTLAGRPAPRPVAAAPEGLGRWFDADTGIFAEAHLDGPEYPLAHGAFRVNFIGADGKEDRATLGDWGISPDIAAEKALMASIATLVSSRLGHRPRPGVSPIIAARTSDDLVAQASASALASLPGFIGRTSVFEVDLETMADADGQMLARLARLYTGGLPTIFACDGDHGGCVAWAKLGAWIVVGIAPDLTSAIVEVLGEALSAHQMSALPGRQHRFPHAMLRTDGLPAALGGCLPDGDPVAAPTPTVRTQFVTDPAVPPDIVVGYAEAAAA